MITREELARIDREHLHDEANLDLYLDWYALKAPDQGISLSELVAMPAAMREDFGTIQRIIGRHRAANRRRRK